MKIKQLYKNLVGIGLVCAGGACAQAQTSVPGTFKHVTIDGSFSDWTGVPVAYTAPVGPTNAIQYENVYIANDQNNIYIRFTLYSPRANAFANSYDNIFIDGDGNAATGNPVDGIGSEMLVQWGGGYQEKNGGFNEGAVNNLGWSIAGDPTSTDFEIAISRNATFASDGTPVFSANPIALLLEGDNISYINAIFAPASGGFTYAFADAPVALTDNLPLVTLSSSSWQVNASGTDLGTDWLDSAYDDSQSPWISGSGLFGFTPSPGAYPAINTPLSSSGQNTFYYRTHFSWNNLPDNVAFVMTNYLSDGAVYYVNGAEVARVRMPAGTVGYATSASATNAPTGHADYLAISGDVLQIGDNILEVETHQAPASSADMVFGLSLTAAAQFPILNADTNHPANRFVVAGNPTTFAPSLIASGPLSYQWLKAGNPISGATNATYTIPVVLGTDAGSYSLLVSNPLSTNTTRAAVLTVSNQAVSLSNAALPADVVVVAGQAFSLAASIAGSPPLQFQWYQGGSPLTGATNSTYTIPFAVSVTAGSYYVSVSNPANSTNSRTATVTVLPDTLPPVLTHIATSKTQVFLNFSKPVDPTSATVTAHYSLSGGYTVTGAATNPADATQVILTTSGTLGFGTVYTVSVNGVKDLFGNNIIDSGTFARTITIDGSFADWDGMVPIYSGPSGSDGAADFANIYMFNDDTKYYFYVTLWHDIPPASGQFPAYVNMFFNTDGDITTGYIAGSVGSELLIQSGYSYQEKNGGFNEGSINNLNWTCLPAAPGTNFEFSVSRLATFASDNTPVFPTNTLSFIFQGMTPGFVAVNQAPGSGLITYTNVAAASATSLPLGKLALDSLPAGKSAVIWNSPGTLQERLSLIRGGWTNLPAATSPYVIPNSDKQHYFRLAQ